MWRDADPAASLRRRLLVTLAAALVVPYLGSTLGLGRVELLLASTTAFFAGAGLFSSLRVLSRTPSLLRALPLTPAVVRDRRLAVPAVPILVWGLAATPARAHHVDGRPGPTRSCSPWPSPRRRWPL